MRITLKESSIPKLYKGVELNTGIYIVAQASGALSVWKIGDIVFIPRHNPEKRIFNLAEGGFNYTSDDNYLYRKLIPGEYILIEE